MLPFAEAERQMLENVAEGVSILTPELIEVYQTIRYQQKAYAFDVNRLCSWGIPIHEYLAKTKGVNQDQISDMVLIGAIRFSDVRQAFQRMTASGGAFAI